MGEDEVTSTDNFDWEQFYTDYGDVSGGYDPETAPTDADVLAAIESGSSTNSTLSKLISQFGDKAVSLLKSAVLTNGSVDMAKLGTLALGAYGAMGGNAVQTGGYSKPVPKLDMTRQQVAYTDAERVPGSAGRQYFTDPQFTTQGDAGARAGAQSAAGAQSQGIMSAYNARPAAPAAAPIPAMRTPWENAAPAAAPTAAPASGVAALMPVPQATGFAQGGSTEATKGRYLSGNTDGMADEIPTSIDGEQDAALSHGEFVIPADVVSHLGNGNSEAGADKLHQMMDRIRKARTGNSEQGKQINPDKFMPGGLAAAYAAGGSVQGYATGDLVTTPGAATPADTPATTAATTGPDLGKSTSSNLSPWAGDYVTDYLGKGQAIANAPQQVYGGPLTAGAAPLQQQAFAGISGLAQQGFTPTQFSGGTFGQEQAQQYMDPYIQSALNPQLAEMGRQAEITRMGDAGRLVKAGAFGGSRQAVMESEGNKNLLSAQTQAIGSGYQTAYDKAMVQYNADQGRSMEAQKATEASRTYSADYGLKSLQDLSSMGATQRNIAGEGIAADKAQFEEQRDYPAKMAQFQKDLMTGLPITTSATTANTTGVSDLMTQISGLQALYKTLGGVGGTAPTTAPVASPTR
jgi:hypothetical protein